MADDFDPYYTWLGIPPEEQPPDHYRLLGVRRYEGNADVITNAMDQRMHYLRSLQVGKRSTLSQKILNEVSAAGVVLLDAKRRTEYDQQLRAKDAARQTPVLPPQAAATSAPPLPRASRPLPVAAPLTPATPVAVDSATPSVRLSPATSAAARLRRGKDSIWQSPMVIGGAAFAGVAVLGLIGMLVVMSRQKPPPPPPDKGTTEIAGTGKGNGNSTNGKGSVSGNGNGTVIANGKKGKTITDVVVTPRASGRPWWTDDAVKRQLFALELEGADQAAIDKTAALVALDKPFTVETWVKIDFGQSGTTQIIGTGDGMSRSARPGGWRLLVRRQINDGQTFDHWILEGWSADQKRRFPQGAGITGGIPGDRWTHVAIVHNVPSGTVVYLDGRPLLRIDSPLLPRETDLVLGATPGSAPQPGIKTQLCGLRISDKARYSGPFAPPSPLEMEHDSQTAASLNFVMPMHQAVAGGVRRGDAPWQYGYGQFDDASKRVTKFAQFTEFNGVQWKSEKSIPGGHGQWVSLDPLGGHTGSQPDLSAIRRWTAPQDGTVAITGKLTHFHEDRFGDGVRGRIVANSTGSAGQWDSRLETVETNVEKLDVKRGDTVDFVVECKDNNHCDKFAWPVELRLTGADGMLHGQWNSQDDFQGPGRVGAVAAMARLGGVEWRTLDGNSGVKGLRLAEVPQAAADGDLIAASANDRRLLRGTLTKQGDFLRLGPAPTAVVLPVGLPEQYDLEAEVVRESGNESICLAIPVPGNRRLTAIVDGMAAMRTGLASVNSQQLFTAGNPLVQQGRLLTNGQPAVIRLEVRSSGVKLLVDGKLITHWQSNPSDVLNHAKGMGGFNDKGALGILTWNAPYLIKRLAMTPHAGGDAPSPSPATGPRIELVQKHATALAPERGRVDYSDPGGWLLTGPVTSFTIPEPVPDEYVIEAEITREEGTDAIGFNLPVRGSSLTALIDGYNSRLTGLSNIGGATIQSPENKTVHRGAVLTVGEPAGIRITVNRREITLAVDGETISRWDYDPDAQLEPFTGSRTKNPERIGVTAWNAKYRIRRLDLLPASGPTPLAGSSIPLIDAQGKNVRPIAGNYEVTAGTLVTGADLTKVVLAEELPDEYTLQAEVTRLEGKDTLGFGLHVQGRPLSVLIDGWGSSVSGICLVPGQDGSSPRGSTMKTGPLLTNDKPAQLKIVVDKRQVQLEVDGSIVARWQNEPNAELRAFGGYESPEPGKLAITTASTRYRIANLTLLPAAASSSPPRPEPPPPPLGTASKTPIPNAEALAAAKTQFTAVYGTQLKGAKTAPAKLAVAKKVFEDARTTRDMPVRYYMLEECRKLFVESRDFASALDTADLTSQDFAADALTLKLGVLEGATQGGALPPAQRALLVSEACALGFEAIDADRLDMARSIAPVVRKLSARAADDVQAEAKEFLDEFALRQKRSDVVKRAEQELAAKPDDAGAHLTLGLYYYFDLGEPAKGLPHLEKGSDPKLAAAAREQQAARGMAGSLPEAKAWQAAITGAPAEYKQAIQRRALEAFEAAIPVVEGFERTQATQARDQLKADLKGSSTAASKRGPRIRKNDLPETSPGLVGSITLPNGQPAGLFVTYQPGRSMSEEKLQAVLRQAASPGAILHLEGYLRCASPVRVTIFQRGSNSGTKQVLAIDGNPVSEVGGNRMSRSLQLDLAAGEHKIVWTVAFDGNGGPLLSIFDPNGPRPPEFHFKRDQHYFFRRTAKSELEVSD